MVRFAHRAALIGLTAVTWVAIAAAFGLPDTLIGSILPFGSAMTVTGLGVGIFNWRAWSWPPFHRILTHQPDLRGVWRVTISSTWKDPKTGKLVPPVKGYAQIDQDGSSFCLRLYTEKAESRTIAYSFTYSDKVYELAFVYDNEPKINLRSNGSPLHKGSAIVKARGQKPKKINGYYWTERKTTGEIVLEDRSKGEVNSFDEGMRIFKNSPPTTP